jgi:hypothetical protein
MRTAVELFSPCELTLYSVQAKLNLPLNRSCEGDKVIV